MTRPHAAVALEPLPAYREVPQPEMIERARAFHAELVRRRTVRDFDSRSVPREVIEHCLLAAGTAPSGANQQPWFFSVITDPTHKQRVREADRKIGTLVLDPAVQAPHYYVPESVGIASGFLIAALHHAGLATLTHTPNPMSFLNKLCGRPTSEKPVILLVVGYPKAGCQVPLHGGIKKPLEALAQWL